ncbi:MAG: hypothetical protein AAF752_01540 [Bacteroidota bacterium]
MTKLFGIAVVVIVCSGCTPTRYFQDSTNSLDGINRALEGREVSITHEDALFRVQARNVVIGADSVRFERAGGYEAIALKKVDRISEREGKGQKVGFLIPFLAGTALTAWAYTDIQNCVGPLCGFEKAAIVLLAGLTAIVSLTGGAIGARRDLKTVYFDRTRPPPELRVPLHRTPAVPTDILR